MENISVFLPVRSGSQRVKKKNTRPIGKYLGGLLEIKLRQLVKIENIDEVVLSTNDEESINVYNNLDINKSKCRLDNRPESLCLSTTPLDDLIRYVPQIIKNEHILWTHVTSPFCDTNDYVDAIHRYFIEMANGFDSLISGQFLQNYLIEEKSLKVLGFEDNKTIKWPRTQDLPRYFELNHAIFLTRRETYLSQKDRVGKKMVFFEQAPIKSIDVDWEEDFKLVEKIYDRIIQV